MRFPPLGERSFHAALVRDIKVRGESADVMQGEKSTRFERGVPKIQFLQRRVVFVRAVGGSVRVATRFLGATGDWGRRINWRLDKVSRPASQSSVAKTRTGGIEIQLKRPCEAHRRTPAEEQAE